VKPRQHNLVEPRAIREADATMTKHGNRKKDYAAITVPFSAIQRAEPRRAGQGANQMGYGKWAGWSISGKANPIRTSRPIGKNREYPASLA